MRKAKIRSLIKKLLNLLEDINMITRSDGVELEFYMNGKEFNNSNRQEIRKLESWLEDIQDSMYKVELPLNDLLQEIALNEDRLLVKK